MERKLRPYQEEGKEYLLQHRRAILADEPGLGKTATTLKALQAAGVRNALIVGPKVSLGVWQDEAEAWIGVKSVIYTGSPYQRAKRWREFKAGNGQFLITNYAQVEEVLSLQSRWRAVVADEVHLGGLLNKETKSFETFSKIVSDLLILISGTPVRRSPADLWTLLHLIDPKKFTSYWKHVDKYCVMIRDRFSHTIEPVPKNALEHKAMIDNYMIRRRKVDVLTDLPPKSRYAKPLTLDEEDQKLYDEIAQNMQAEVDGQLIVAQNRVVQLLRLRQLLVTPQLLGLKRPGSTFEGLVDLIDAEFSSGRSVALFTPFAQAVPLIKQHLIQAKLTKSIYTITGQLTAEQIRGQAKGFQDNKTQRKGIIASIKSGASWTAHTASTGFFLGYDWSAINNIQAEDRIHRFGQLNPVDIYYLLFKGTVDEGVMQRLDDKQMAANWTLSPEEMMQYVRPRL